MAKRVKKKRFGRQGLSQAARSAFLRRPCFYCPRNGPVGRGTKRLYYGKTWRVYHKESRLNKEEEEEEEEVHPNRLDSSTSRRTSWVDCSVPKALERLTDGGRSAVAKAGRQEAEPKAGGFLVLTRCCKKTASGARLVSFDFPRCGLCRL